MIRKTLWLLVVVGVIGLLGLSAVAAQEAGVSRSLPAGPVAPGDELDVTISNVGLTNGFGSAKETLPAGFSYVEGSAVVTVGAASTVIHHAVEDQTDIFTLLGVDSFTYKVAVGSEVGDGQHTFSGVLKKGLSDEAETIGGDDSVTVEAGTTTPPDTGTPEPPPPGMVMAGDVSRSLPAGPVAPGDELDVTISNVGLTDGFGSAEETLPAGFSYVEGSAVVTVGAASTVIHHAVEDQTDIFTLLGVDSFTYKVAVGSEVGDGQHTFSGVLKKGLSDEAETFGGDDSVTVEAGTTTPPDTGTPGLRGPAGPKGDTGPAGPSGNTGHTGPEGDTGRAGPEGDTGVAGPAGPKGDTGVAGPAGLKGDTGVAGPAGPKGDTGVAGPAGPKGDTGVAGPAGPKGDTGVAGPVGPKGDTGVAGPVGPKGDTGVAGSIGPKGDTGVAGSIGPKGDTGVAGSIGPKGDTGVAGSIGPKGDTGVAGSIGPKGDTGVAGSIVLGIVSLILSFVAVLVVGGVLLMRRRD